MPPLPTPLRRHPSERSLSFGVRLLSCAPLLFATAGCGLILEVDDYGVRATSAGGSPAVCTSEAPQSFDPLAAMTLKSGAGRGIRVAAANDQVFLAGELIAGVELAFGDGPALTSPDGDGVFLAGLAPGAADPHLVSLALTPAGPGAAYVLEQTLAREGRDGPVTAIALVGEHTGTLAFSTGSVPPAASSQAGPRDAFVAVVDPDGAPRWLRSFGDPGEQRALGAAIDGSGRLVVAVHGDGSFEFGPTCPVDAGADAAIFLAAFELADGSCAWATALPTGVLQQPLHPRPIDLAYSPADDALVLVGATRDSSWFGPSDGIDEVFVLRIGADHEPRPPVFLGGVTPGFGERWAEAVATDDCGGAFVGGGFRNDLTIGGEVLQASTSHRDDDAEADAFVCKITRDDAVAWCHLFRAPGAQSIADIATDGAGLVAVSGALHHSGPVDLGGGAVITPDEGSRDALVAALIDRGDHAVPALGRALGDDEGREQEANGAAIDPSGRVAVAGTFFAALRHADPPGGLLLGGGYTPFVLSFAPAP